MDFNLPPPLILHPNYINMCRKWTKYRYIMGDGEDFINKYLYPWSSKETVESLNLRKAISYSPAHAKAEVLGIKNAIYKRMVDIIRKGGPVSYSTYTPINVDNFNRSMTAFMGQLVLEELITMGGVGIFIDKDVNIYGTLAGKKRPYLYLYTVENILNMNFDDNGTLIALLLRDSIYTKNDANLVSGSNYRYRLFQKIGDDIILTKYIDDKPTPPVKLSIGQIPFIYGELSNSLLADIAEYQIALLQLASSDIYYGIKANFPFLTEQYDQIAEATVIRPIAPVITPAVPTSAQTLTAQPATSASSASVGVEFGRRYGKGLERPEFIAPPTEPLIASIEKQKIMREEIKQILNITLSNTTTRNQSAVSKREDTATLENGLAYIGLELERIERAVGNIWADYENGDPPIIYYPTSYSLKSDTERLAESKDLMSVMGAVPSLSYQRNIAKRIAHLNISSFASASDIADVYKDIEAAEVVVCNPEEIRLNHEAGLLSTDTASKSLLYPDGEAAQAAIDHAERAKRIAMAQSAATYTNSAARGVTDLSSSPVEEAKQEKSEDFNGS